MESGRKIGFKSLAAYGCGDLYGGGSFLIISTLFLFFLTDVVGLAPALAGAVVFAGKAWDAVSDPMMGCISDRTRSKFGRRRLYFLIGIIPVFVSFALLWVSVKTGSQALTFLYYFLTYILFCTVSTMVMIPYAALPAEMSADYKDRTRLSGARMLCSQVSALLAGTIPGYLVKNVYKADPVKGFLIVGIVFGIFYALPWIFVFLGTWEPEKASSEASSKGLGQSFKDLVTLLRSKSYRIHIGMYLFAYTAMDILSALFVYYVTYYLGRGGLYTLLLGSMLIAQLIMLPVYMGLANKIGKGKTYTIGACVVFAVSIAFLFAGPNTPTPLLMALSAGFGLGLSALVSMPWAMLPESADVDALIYGEQRTGAVSGTFTLSRKLVQALVLWVVSLALGAIGYVPNAVQSPSTLSGIRILFSALPLLCVALGGIVALRYPVTPQTFAVIRAELDRRSAGGDLATASEETKAVCGRVTGLPSDELFGMAGR
jgi:oligogalacturonide transporter